MRGMDIEYKGCKGISAISEMTGIPDSTLRHRIYKKGLDIDMAVKKASGATKHYEYKGVVGLKDIAKKFGINYNTLRRRISDLGMSIDEAVTTPVINRAQKKETVIKKAEVVGIKNPDLLNHLWKLALGIGGSHA